MENVNKIIETLKGILVKFKPVWIIFVKIMKFLWEVFGWVIRWETKLENIKKDKPRSTDLGLFVFNV